MGTLPASTTNLDLSFLRTTQADEEDEHFQLDPADVGGPGRWCHRHDLRGLRQRGHHFVVQRFGLRCAAVHLYPRQRSHHPAQHGLRGFRLRRSTPSCWPSSTASWSSCCTWTRATRSSAAIV